MDIDNISNNVNKKIIISVIIVIGIVLASIVGAVGVYQTVLVSDDSEEEPEEDYGIYEYIPSDTTMMYQMDAVGFADDQVTRDVLNELGSENIDDLEENWYNESYDEYVEHINEEDIDVDELEGEFDIEQLKNVIVFSDMNINEEFSNLKEMDYETEEEIEEHNFGLMIEFNFSEYNLEEIINPDGELNTTEYQDIEIYTEEDEMYIAQLDSQMAVMTNSEDYMENVIDTSHGDKDFISTDMIPEYDNTYMSVSVREIDEFYDSIIEEIDNDMEDIDAAQNDPLFEMYAGEFEEELEDSYDEWEEFKDYPTPQEVKLSYSTDNENTLRTRTEVTFNTLEAASQFNRDLDEQDGNVTVDITLSDTKVIIEQETTSDVVINEVNSVIEMYEDFFDSGGDFDDDWEEDDWEEQGTDAQVEFNYLEQDNSVEVTVTELGEDEYVSISVFFEEEDMEIINEDNTVEWADADEEGQVITIENITDNTLMATAIESESDLGEEIDTFTVPSDDKNEEDIETDDERVEFTHYDESIDVNVLSLNDGEQVYMHVHHSDNYKINNEDTEIDGAIVADEEGQTVNIENISEDTIITVIVRESDSTYVDSLEYSVSNEEISEFEWDGYNTDATIQIEESDTGIRATIIRMEGDIYLNTKVNSDNEYEVIGAEDTPDWTDANDVGQEINIENLSVGDEVIIYSSMGEDERSYRVQSYELTE